MNLSRKQFNKIAIQSYIGSTAIGSLGHLAAAETNYQFNYILCSAMYGNMKLDEVLPEVHKTGSNGIDLWPKVHADHREQAEAMGKDAFRELLNQHQVKIKGMACYKLGPFGLQKEMQYAKDVSGPGVTFVCASRGPKKLKPGPEMKQAMADFCEKLKPHVEVAEKLGMSIAIENHSNSLLHTKESVLWFAEMSTYSDVLGIAFAPHHFEKLGLSAEEMEKLIHQIGPKINYFYAQQLGKGSYTTMPKEDELLQMPGRGPLNFAPLAQGLRKINYRGPMGIFMHPYPRGLPILKELKDITKEINRSRTYLNRCLEKVT